jgi:hypothetical protein
MLSKQQRQQHQLPPSERAQAALSIEARRFRVEQAIAEAQTKHLSRKTALLTKMGSLRGKVAVIHQVEVRFQRLDKQHEDKMYHLMERLREMAEEEAGEEVEGL